MKTIILTALVLFALAAPAAAQTPVIVLPSSSIQFTASPDQATIGIDGNPLLTGYSVTYCLKATPSSCLAPVNLGKPTPDATNTITVATGIFGSLVANQVYLATVTATGPGGSSAPSSASNPFGVESAPGTVTGAIVVKR